MATKSPDSIDDDSMRNLKSDTKVEDLEESSQQKVKNLKSRKSIVRQFERHSTQVLREDESDDIDSDDDELSDEECDQEYHHPQNLGYTIDAQKVATFGLGVAIGYFIFKYMSRD